ncbi:hypothetical protein PSENEW3_00004248 [Picochlorum sp. SENEW3]|nr:hypothetical protein PSENEW3_00004248 [Picochlorum sp. SENEW3]
MRARIVHVIVSLLLCPCLFTRVHSEQDALDRSTANEQIDIRGILECRQDDVVCGPIALNCSGDGNTDVQTVLTDLANMTRYTGPWSASSLPESDIYAAAAQFSPPGVQSSCLSRSPGVSASCTQGCVETQDIFAKTWDVSGNAICSGKYPNGPGVESSQERGTVTIIVLNECRNIEYGPPWMATVRDELGCLWALQSAATAMRDYEAWLRNLKSVYWPKGWVYEEIIPTTNETKTAYLVGNDCIIVQLRDSNGNTWQMYDYPAEGAQSVLTNLSCYKMTQSMFIDDTTGESMDGETVTSLGVLQSMQMILFLLLFAYIA